MNVARRSGVSHERGAAAVEFAFVAPLLIALLLGILDYGIWFSESLNLRQVVRESARQAVVKSFDTSCAGNDIAKVVCATNKELSPIAGTAYTRVALPGAEWKRGDAILVCSMVDVDAVTGFTPLPSGGVLRSKTTMSIESDDPPATGTLALGPALPAGLDWSWCDD